MCVKNDYPKYNTSFVIMQVLLSINVFYVSYYFKPKKHLPFSAARMRETAAGEGKGEGVFFYRFSICQSIGSSPFFSRNALVLEKGLLPKNPRKADRGLGWGDSRIRCLGLCSMAFSSVPVCPTE